MSAEKESDFICDVIFSDPLDFRGAVQLDEDVSEVEHPIGEFLAKSAAELSLAKNGVPAVDPAWSEEIGAGPRIALSQDFLRRSDARLERVNEQIRKFFRGNFSEMAEALQLAKDTRDHVRQEFIGAQ